MNDNDPCFSLQHCGIGLEAAEYLRDVLVKNRTFTSIKYVEISLPYIVTLSDFVQFERQYAGEVWGGGTGQVQCTAEQRATYKDQVRCGIH